MEILCLNESYSCFYPVLVEIALLGASTVRRIAAVRFIVAAPFGMNSTVGCRLMLAVKLFNGRVFICCCCWAHCRILRVP